MHKMASVIEKMNAFDPNMVSEPNYQERLNGHKEALEIIRGMDKTSVNEDFLRIIIYNSSFMIRTCDDLALRNSASYLLQESAKVFATVMPDFQELCNLLIFDTLLPEVQKGLKCNLEAIRHEFIGILSAVLHSCKDHPRLKDLFALCHEDPDLDFWENMRHLQVHRRARALLRFSNHLKSQHEHGEKIAVHYLLAYMIPIVSSFLFDEAYRKHVHVVDAAIETLGSIANVLPWHHYETLLKNYLNMLSKDVEHHKTIVKIIVSLLNAFHFDLTLKKENSTSVHNENKTEEIDMKAVSAECFATDMKETVEVAENDVNEASDLTPAMANKIYNTIKRNILPLLHRSLMKKAKSDDEHKYAGHYYPEDEEILRVPIALAMVKLLQKLPPGSLEKNLPGLLLKMCDLLKSRTESIRETTRDTLLKMMQSLGPKYFHCLLSEMKSMMKKGYQVHVMTFTINTVLVSLSDQMVSGDLDESVNDLTEICISELFSDVAEEKEVTKITGKLKEARSFKSYSIFQILSKYVSENLLLELITPLKEVLERKYSYKAMKKVIECLRHIALGLSDNNGVSPKGHLIFIHAVINENIPGLNQKNKPEMPKTSKFVRPDIFLVPKEPGRSGPPAKINKRTNAHVLVEFGLQLFTFCLKKDKIDKNAKEILEMLDPFVALLSDFLTSNHMKIISISLRCLLSLYKFPLPSLKTVTKNIVNSLFILINKYSATGMGQGENFEMILMCFKVLTVLVRDTSYHKLSDEQLHSLLSYIEQDIYDYTRQATAFSLLKALLSKKLEAPVLKGIMIKIAEMSITAEQDYVRTQCRQTCLQYVLDYPLGKQLVKTISFFIAQLEYLQEHGRISAFEMINSMLDTFPEVIVKKHSALFMVPLAARLVNDESAKCRKMAALCLKQLFIKVEHDGRLSLYSIVLNWLQAKKLSYKRLGTQVCGIFAEVEGEQFESHLREILPIVTELISIKKNEAKSNTDERCEDHFLYHLLNSLLKILTYCPIIKKEEFSEKLNVIWENVQGLILHPHVWIRFATSQLFGLLLSTYTVEEICAAICSKKKTASVYLNTKQKLRDISADFATQLQSVDLKTAHGEQIIRNLVYIAKVNSMLSELSDESINESSEKVEVTLEWIIRRLCREAKKEVANSPDFSERRRYVFMFIAAIAHELGKEKVFPMLNSILVPLCREISDASERPDEDLKKTAQEVLDLLANIVGIEEFTGAYADVQSTLFKKKMKRKREKAQEAVTKPQSYAQKRIKKQLKKKESKKRRILKQKGKKKPKKRTWSDLVFKK
ncbi:Small subunit processome component 20-like protein, partial [Stegodyphus mimosarum]